MGTEQIRSVAGAERQLKKRVALAALSPANARREIARDVIAAVVAKKITATKGRYLELTVPGKKNELVELQSLLAPGKNHACNVCAIGACLVAVVARDDAFAIDLHSMEYCERSYASSGDEVMRMRLASYFDVRQLAVIEAAFEYNGSYVTDQTRAFKVRGISFEKVRALADRCERFGCRWKEADDRMVAIMRNVVRHGEFKP